MTACLEVGCSSTAQTLSAWCAEHGPRRWTRASLPPASEPASWVDRHAPGGLIRQERWEVDGRLHRTDGPALVIYRENGTVRIVDFALHGNVHRDEGPAAVVVADRGWTETYVRHGTKHRSDGPAIVSFDNYGSVKWGCYVVEGVIHRLDGPAQTRVDDDGLVTHRWFIEGRQVSPDAVASYTEALASGAPVEWALAYALGEPVASSGQPA